MRGKKILFGVLAIMASAMLSAGVAACNAKDESSSVGASSLVSSSTVQNSSNTQNDGSSTATNTENENGDTTSSSLVNGSETESSSGNASDSSSEAESTSASSSESSSETESSSESSSESNSEMESSSENSSESSSDDKKDDSSFDDSDYETDCVVYTLSEDGLSASVTDYTGSPTKVKILSKYQGVPVTSIGAWAFYECSSLTSVVIPESVTSIGEYVFSGCSSLTSIEIPDSVTSIGIYAFYKCSSLTSIEIPDSVTSIGGSAFSACSSLTIYCEAASKPSGWNSYWYSSCPVVWDCKNNDIASDGYIYTMIDGIRYGIKDGEATVVEQPSNIQKANIPVSIMYKNAIYSVTSIGNYAFNFCSDLTNVVIGAGLTSIGDCAFQGCSSLTNIDVSENNVNYKSIDGNLYGKDGATLVQYAIGKTATEFVIPDSVTSIGKGAFSLCSNLMNIVIPDSVTSIGCFAFNSCTGLTRVIIPDSVVNIEDSAFFFCKSLTIYCEAVSQPSDWVRGWRNGSAPVVWDCNNKDVADDGYIYTMVDGIRYGIKDDEATVVIQQKNIQTANIPADIIYNDFTYAVTRIGDDAFYYSSSITNIEIPDSVTSIGRNAFYNCGCLTSISVSENNVKYKSIDGNLYSKDGTTLIQYAIGKTATEFVISNAVTNIGNYAFYGCNNLTSVIIGGSVTSIGDSAFRECSSLASIEIPDSVTSIGDSVFDHCDSLEYTVKDGLKYLGNTNNPYVLLMGAETTDITTATIADTCKFIYQYAFAYCSSLASVVIPDSVTSIGGSAFSSCSNLTSIEISDGVTSISEMAFDGCWNLTSVVIPDSVTSIGEMAFDGCRNLTSVKIGDSVASIGEWAFDGCWNLTSVVIPDGVTSIGRGAFSGCSSLTCVVIGDGVTNIGEYAFYDCDSLSEVYYNGTESEWNAIDIDSSNDKLTSATQYYCSEEEPTEEGNYWHYVDGVVTKW